MSITSLIAASGAMLGFFIAIALGLTRGGRAYANRVLAVVILLSTSYLLSLIPTHTPALSGLSFLRLGGISVFLFGPALFLYVKAMTDRQFRLESKHLAHAIPYVLIVLDGMHLFGDQQIVSRPKLVGVAYYLQMITYLLLGTLQLRGFQHQIAENYSALEGISLRWLVTLVSASLALCAIGLTFALGRLLYDVISWPQQVWSISIMVTLNYLIAFFAISQPQVFNHPGASSPIPAASNPEPARYATSSLSPEQAQGIWARTEQLMASERPYLQNELKIGELAASLDIPVNHLSQSINQVGGCSFFSYINRYRVKAAEDLLGSTSPGENTMLDVAMSSGFNSESAFYKHFRKELGVTPRQFQQQN